MFSISSQCRQSQEDQLVCTQGLVENTPTKQKDMNSSIGDVFQVVLLDVRKLQITFSKVLNGSIFLTTCNISETTQILSILE